MLSLNDLDTRDLRDGRRLVRVALLTTSALVAGIFANMMLQSNQTPPGADVGLDLQRRIERERMSFESDLVRWQVTERETAATPVDANDRIYRIDPKTDGLASLAPVTDAEPAQSVRRIAELLTQDASPLRQPMTWLVKLDQKSQIATLVPDPRTGEIGLLGLRDIKPSLSARIAATDILRDLTMVPLTDLGQHYAVLALADDGRDVAWEWSDNASLSSANVAAWLLALLALGGGLLIRRSVLALASREAEALKLAGRDLLCDVPNRILFTQLLDSELARHERSHSRFALFYLDLDRFKDINDRYGHDAGDRMIVAVMQRIRSVLRAEDHLGRLGGDEFAILQTGVHTPTDAKMLAERILRAMSQPLDLGAHEVGASISIGIALCPENGADRQELMCLADMALYRAKNDGRNRYAFFERSMGEAIRKKKAYEDELRLAIETDQLDVHYQPIMNGDGSRMLGVEALARWPHATRGPISPEDFVGLAEDRGLIRQMGEWVLRRACHDARAWPDLKVAVNVSPLQFRDKDFVATVQKILTEAGLSPKRLEIEMTESALVSDEDLADAAITALRAMGVRMSLDDFGTGFSSLIYLRRFSFDKIKIDRSFIDTMKETGDSAIIVHSIVHLGRALGLTVTAEGVENAEHLRFLQAVGCHELQGFFFSQAVTAHEITSLYRAADMPRMKISA